MLLQREAHISCMFSLRPSTSLRIDPSAVRRVPDTGFVSPMIFAGTGAKGARAKNGLMKAAKGECSYGGIYCTI